MFSTLKGLRVLFSDLLMLSRNNVFIHFEGALEPLSDGRISEGPGTTNPWLGLLK